MAGHPCPFAANLAQHTELVVVKGLETAHPASAHRLPDRLPGRQRCGVLSSRHRQPSVGGPGLSLLHQDEQSSAGTAVLPVRPCPFAVRPIVDVAIPPDSPGPVPLPPIAADLARVGGPARST